MKHKLVAHNGVKFDGYKLTYNGYDYLALQALTKRGHLNGIGRRIGVGKESDIHTCEAEDGTAIAAKLHRLGRVSFKTVKANRDYHHGQYRTWMQLARYEIFLFYNPF